MSEWYNPSGYEIGRPFQGEIYWYLEDGYGTGIPSDQGVKGRYSVSVSSVVEVARMETGEVNKYYRGIDSVYISKATKTNTDRTFHLEYLLQTDDALLEYLVDRSVGTVRSLGFIVGANTDMTGMNSWWEMKGCKCKTVEIASSTGEAWKVSADFSVSGTSVNDVQTDIAAAGEPKSSVTDAGLTGDIAMFNVGATIKAGVSATNLAYVSDSFSVTVNHNTQDLWNVGSREKTNVIESALDCTGTADISLDAGGRLHFQDVLDADTATTIVVTTALVTGAPVITLTNVRWDSSSIDVSPGNEAMMESAPFTAEQIAVSTRA